MIFLKLQNNTLCIFLCIDIQAFFFVFLLCSVVTFFFFLICISFSLIEKIYLLGGIKLKHKTQKVQINITLLISILNSES